MKKMKNRSMKYELRFLGKFQTNISQSDQTFVSQH